MRFLIVDKVHPVLKEKLNNAHIDCDIDEHIHYDKALSVINQYDGLIIRSKFKVDRNFLLHATHLKYIGRVGSGLENIDVTTASELGIVCINSPEGNRNAVAEHALGLLLNLLNNISKSYEEVKKGIWQREANRGTELKGKTVGIIGFGNTGSTFAQKLSSFECTILAYDKYKKGFANDYVQEVSLYDIQKNSDIISFHVPLTEETHYYLNQSFIEACLKPFYLINTSRGSIVNTVDLLNALKNKKIIGAGLDVIEYEDLSFEKTAYPDTFYELLSLPNVIITPHIAGWTHESNKLLAEILADKIINHIQRAGS